MQFKSDIDVRLVQHCGGDHMVVAAAKVSTSGPEAEAFAKPDSAEGNAGLIRYLIANRHGSPFEHGSMTFYVHAPIFVWREWHRHRIGFCLAGDTEIWTQSRSKSGLNLRKRRIEELWHNWHVGVTDRAHTRSAGAAGYQIAVEERTRLLPSCRQIAVRTLNEQTQFIESANPTDIIQSGIKELFSIVCSDGKQLKCSKDHQVLTQDGWAKAGELRKGDMVAVNGKRSIHAERNVPPSLRSGIGVWTSMQRKRLIREIDNCYVCDAQHPREVLELDHVIPVVTSLTSALDVENLKPICPTCATIKNASEQKLAQRGCVAGSKFVRLIETPYRVSEEMTYDISMPAPHHNFVANGIVVHNSYNEESGRYKQLEPVFYLPKSDRPMFKVDSWRPGRPKFLPINGETGKAAFNRLTTNLSEQYESSYSAYERNLALGIDPGLARDCLPVGIYSACWVTCNPRSLMAFLSLRTHEPTATAVSYPLWEIDVAARKCEEIFAGLWPITHAAFCANGRVAP